MSLFPRLRVQTRTRALKGSVQHRSPARRFQPRLELLEDRWLPSTLTVTNNLDSGAGSLRADIAASKSKDIIVFAPSLHGQTITLTSGELDITKDLTIQGPGAGQLTISGDNASRVFEVGAGAKVSLSGLTITQGNDQAGDGAGIFNKGTLTVSYCTLSGNRAWYYGGGIYNSDGIDNAVLTLSNCTLSANSAGVAGGGIYNNGLGAITISNCTISANTTQGTGGGIANVGPSSLTLLNSTFVGNIAWDGTGGRGGAVYNDNGSVTMNGCAMSGNTSYDGGALWTYDFIGSNNKPVGTVTVTGCTVTGNTGWDWEGAGIWNNGSSWGSGSALTISDSVFSQNVSHDPTTGLVWIGPYTNVEGPWINGGGNSFS